MAERQTLNIETLEIQHRGLSVELEALMRHAHLTPKEESAARALKKKKLDTKDRIMALRRVVRA
jgi:hypothetical protein